MITFPFVGIGGLTAIAVLVVGYAVFAGLLRLLDAAATGTMSVVPGLVTGVRQWTRDWRDEPATPSAPPLPWEDLPQGTALEDQVGAE